MSYHRSSLLAMTSRGSFLNSSLPSIHDKYFCGCTTLVEKFLRVLSYTTRSLGFMVYDLFISLSLITSFPSSRTTSTLFSLLYEAILNLVPNTLTLISGVFTINGLFLSLNTSKKASPERVTWRSVIKFPLYFTLELLFNHPVVPSGRLNCALVHAGALISTQVPFFKLVPVYICIPISITIGSIIIPAIRNVHFIILSKDHDFGEDNLVFIYTSDAADEEDS